MQEIKGSIRENETPEAFRELKREGLDLPSHRMVCFDANKYMHGKY